MIPRYRRDFNQRFSETTHHRLLATLDVRSGTSVAFPIAETPVFLPSPLLREMAETGVALTRQLVSDPNYLESARQLIPKAYRMEGETSRPHFMTVDFGFVTGPDGAPLPRLVEMQAFPSVFAFQVLLGEVFKHEYGLDAGLDYFLPGMDLERFWSLFREVVVAGHDPAEVALVELAPWEQKTLPDFLLTSRQLGIPIVDARSIIARQQGRRTALYRKDSRSGTEFPIRRIYNRVIVDELIEKKVKLPYSYDTDLDVEWAGHPNWYYLVSKYSIPYLDHPAVPEAVFLDEWLRGEGGGKLHGRREEILLKPLFSFAGRGIQFGPDDAAVSSIPEPERHNYLIHERVSFGPLIETPYGATQVEVRILYLWPEGGDMVPVLSLARLGRGKMMGVDHNKGQKWVGATSVFTPV